MCTYVFTFKCIVSTYMCMGGCRLLRLTSGVFLDCTLSHSLWRWIQIFRLGGKHLYLLYHLAVFYSFCLIHISQPASNSLRSWGWPWTSDHPASISWTLGSQHAFPYQVCVVLGTEPRASWMLDCHPTIWGISADLLVSFHFTGEGYQWVLRKLRMFCHKSIHL